LCELEHILRESNQRNVLSRLQMAALPRLGARREWRAFFAGDAPG
jgi:hypothetical protein